LVVPTWYPLIVTFGVFFLGYQTSTRIWCHQKLKIIKSVNWICLAFLLLLSTLEQYPPNFRLILSKKFFFSKFSFFFKISIFFFKIFNFFKFSWYPLIVTFGVHFLSHKTSKRTFGCPNLRCEKRIKLEWRNANVSFFAN